MSEFVLLAKKHFFTKIENKTDDITGSMLSFQNYGSADVLVVFLDEIPV